MAFTDLPVEIIAHITKYISKRDIRSWRLCCTLLNNLSKPLLKESLELCRLATNANNKFLARAVTMFSRTLSKRYRKETMRKQREMNILDSSIDPNAECDPSDWCASEIQMCSACEENDQTDICTRHDSYTVCSACLEYYLCSNCAEIANDDFELMNACIKCHAELCRNCWNSVKKKGKDKIIVCERCIVELCGYE